MEYINVKKRLTEFSDEKYKEFFLRICKTKYLVMGVKTPYIRNIAKEIVEENAKEFLENANDNTYEEVLLQGFVIGYMKDDIDVALKYIEEFVPKIDNWAICDCFCGCLKIVKKNKEKVLNLIEKYINSDKEFEIRFGIVMLKAYYIEEKYFNKVIECINRINSEEYFVEMGIAWLVSEMYIKYPDKTMKFLRNNKLNKFTYNKALQKIVESYRIDSEKKDIIKNMKRK